MQNYENEPKNTKQNITSDLNEPLIRTSSTPVILRGLSGRRHHPKVSLSLTNCLDEQKKFTPTHLLSYDKVEPNNVKCWKLDEPCLDKEATKGDLSAMSVLSLYQNGTDDLDSKMDTVQ